jgi:hypothetical protein
MALPFTSGFEACSARSVPAARNRKARKNRGNFNRICNRTRQKNPSGHICRAMVTGAMPAKPKELLTILLQTPRSKAWRRWLKRPDGIAQMESQ